MWWRKDQVVEAFVGEEEFEVYVMFYRDAVGVLKNGANVVLGVGLVKQEGCRALCILDCTEEFGKVKVNSVVLVQSGWEECVIQSFSGEKEKRWKETGDVF